MKKDNEKAWILEDKDGQDDLVSIEHYRVVRRCGQVV